MHEGDERASISVTLLFLARLPTIVLEEDLLGGSEKLLIRYIGRFEILRYAEKVHENLPLLAIREVTKVVDDVLACGGHTFPII